MSQTTSGAQVVLDFNSDASRGARGVAAGTIVQNTAVRDADLNSAGVVDPANANGPPNQVGGTSGAAMITYIAPYSATVQPTSGVLIPAGTYKTSLTIQTLPGSTGNVWLRPDGSIAAANTGILVAAYGGSRSFGGPGFPIPSGDITAMTDGGAPQVVLISGG